MFCIFIFICFLYIIDHRYSNWSEHNIAIPFLVLAGIIIFLLSPIGAAFLHGGIPLPNITIEKVEFQEQSIIAYIRNAGQIDTSISQADINDRIHPAEVEPKKELEI
ncbi:MAG TPA: hypothetical protein VHJ38_03500 [Nitrososphaeraceae archaeon]|jgi:hypothetical protein|nr:hypothetical protein [Nitrososphaeraceae archaeon]